MAKAQPNQNGSSAVETEAIENPVVQEEKREPVIETEDLTHSVPLNKEIIDKIEFIAPNLIPDTRPEADRKLSHDRRILSFLESRHTGDFIKLSDFLKSLYPLPKANEKPAWQNQGVMRKLRQDLMAMRDRREIVFSNTNAERLGDNYHVGEQRLRRDYNIGDLNIEAKLAY